MTSFPLKPLSEISSIFSGYAFKSKDMISDGDIPIIKIANIQNRIVVPACVTSIPKDLYNEKLEKYILKTDDVLIAMTGAGSVGNIGKMRKVDKTFLVNQRVGIIRTNSKLADPEFVYQVLSNKEVENKYYQLGLGAGQPNLSPTMIGTHQIPFPPLPTQHRIADILSAYDDLIENNTRRIHVLEQMAHAIYQEWFGKVDKESLPKGWSIITLDKVSKNFDSKRIPLSSMKRAEMQGEYPYYGAAKVLDHINDYIFDGKYLLIAEDGSVITTDGKPVLQMAYGKFWVNNHTHVLQGTDSISTEYLYLCLSEVSIQGYITGAAQPKINQANLNRIPLILPPKDLLMKANKIFEDTFDMIEILNRKNANLRQTRDLLLPRLVSGEIDVSSLS